MANVCGNCSTVNNVSKGSCQKLPEGGAAIILGGVHIDFTNFRGGVYQFQQL